MSVIDAKIKTLKTILGTVIAPRTVLKAVSATGKKGQIVGFTEDNTLGVMDSDFSFEVDSKPLENSENLISSGGVYTALDSIQKSLEKKQNTLTFDDSPAENSNNPVRSKGIYTSLASKANLVDGMVPNSELPTTATYNILGVRDGWLRVGTWDIANGNVSIYSQVARIFLTTPPRESFGFLNVAGNLANGFHGLLYVFPITGSSSMSRLVFTNDGFIYTQRLGYGSFILMNPQLTGITLYTSKQVVDNYTGTIVWDSFKNTKLISVDSVNIDSNGRVITTASSQSGEIAGPVSSDTPRSTEEVDVMGDSYE